MPGLGSNRLTRKLTLGSLALVPMATAIAFAPVVKADTPVSLPDHLETSNVKYIGNLPTPGDGVGAKVIGNYLYLTSTTGLWIYDVSTPTSPQLVSGINANIAWENEEVPTNGKILGISNSTVCNNDTSGGSCLDLYDVTDKAHPKYLASVDGAGNHTNACIWDCTFFWGSTGAVTDARDPLHPRLIGKWNDAANHLPGKSPHHVREIVPGIILTATQPVMLLSVRPEDGGDILHPVLLATGTNADGRFIHSNRWPNNGADMFALIGGETNFRPQCGTLGGAVSDNGAFMTWGTGDVSKNGKFVKGSAFHMIDEYRVNNGAFVDGAPPANVLGCSVHWFEEHPSFHNGGLVALAAYESGTRFVQVTADGHIKEQGYFLPVGRGSTSAPHWAPDGKTVYLIDYERGFDIVQWTGPTYVPQAAAAPGGAVAGAGALPVSAGGGTLPTTSSEAPVVAWRSAAWLMLLAILGVIAGGLRFGRRAR